MHKFTVFPLHLAAYIKANGATLECLDGRGFVFTSDKPLEEWRIAHSNSCCRRVDIELIGLRKFLSETASSQKS
jgi:hypothetical protein